MRERLLGLRQVERAQVDAVELRVGQRQLDLPQEAARAAADVEHPSAPLPPQRLHHRRQPHAAHQGQRAEEQKAGLQIVDARRPRRQPAVGLPVEVAPVIGRVLVGLGIRRQVVRAGMALAREDARRVEQRLGPAAQHRGQRRVEEQRPRVEAGGHVGEVAIEQRPEVALDGRHRVGRRGRVLRIERPVPEVQERARREGERALRGPVAHARQHRQRASLGNRQHGIDRRHALENNRFLPVLQGRKCLSGR